MATYCKVGVETLFYMRHSLLDVVRNFQGVREVSGIIEIDETFLTKSFKGNPKNNDFIMTRNSRKRGISGEQVCIPTAIDRKGNIIFEMTNKGRINTTDLERLFKIDSDSFICTNSHKSYIKFAKENVPEHIRIASSKHNNGVTTKHLANYLHRFKLLQIFIDKKEIVKARQSLINGSSKLKNTKIHHYITRVPVYIYLE